MYDYVIVGGGSAGCVLAARLSEDPSVSVCLVEAGPADDDPNIRVPSDSPKLFRTHQDWDFNSHLEEHCDRRRVYLPRGKVVGGSGALNGMVYVRGSRAEYDAWGMAGWSFAELLPYFLRSEDNERGASRYHAVGGPLAVSDGRSRNPSALAFVQAAIEAGHPANADFNGETQEGFGEYQLTQRDGERCTGAAAFLHPALDRPNLTVETNVQVHRVLIDKGRAVGVTGSRLSAEVVIRAEREVILSAGSYGSPQLLMLSGIGPARHLRGVGVRVLMDLPEVGRNLQDHAQAWIGYYHDQPISLISARDPRNVAQYESTRTGPLTSNGPETGGFLRSRPQSPGADLQFSAIPVALVDGGLTAPEGHGLSFGACLLQPLSRGRVELASDQPTAKPFIVNNYLAEPADLDTVVEGLRISQEIARQPALEAYTRTPFSVPDSDREADLRAYARRNVQPLYHPVGTCAMGTVVDEKLRVHGVAGLRVVDASVMPTNVRANTMAPTFAIAEKAADLILGRPALAAFALPTTAAARA